MIRYRKACDYYGHTNCANCNHSEKKSSNGLVKYFCKYLKNAVISIQPLYICDNYVEEQLYEEYER